ncbi:MAG: zf-HC2 domain-containing protein [Nitrospira sp.]|uniref:zf-HC2 domain-containing protein n=1 Tax=Nitrospira sp. BLG_1 TaxID=3395883 RepID=UPI001DF061A4|nr:zf-HC2 domain-containing protein [Nitrospira sp.]
MAQEEGPGIVPEITCQEVVQWASAYLDEHIGDERKRQIVLHLAMCAGCETYVKQIATVRKTVGLLPQAEENPKNMDRLREAFVTRASRVRSGS